jgi:hypothetical protein
MADNIRSKAFCTIFSLGDPIAKALNLPGVDLGIRTCLVGENLNFPLFRSFATLKNHFRSIPSKVSLLIPGDRIPDLPLI